MPARKPRATSTKPASDGRFEVLLEDLNDKFRAFGEGLDATRREMREGFAEVNQRLDSMQRAIWSLEQRVGALEAAVTHHSEEIRELRAALSRKPDIDDLRRLEARVAELEKRVGVH